MGQRQKSLVVLLADVTIIYNGETYTGRLGYSTGITLFSATTSTRPENDTVEALNEYLSALAAGAENQIRYTVYLANTAYTGEIVIPEKFAFNDNNIYLRPVGATAEGEKTIIQGGINANGASVTAQNVHFKARSKADSAIYNGMSRAQWCSFYGYGTALTEGCYADHSVFIN